MTAFLKKFASLKVTCVLLVAFLLLTFWGVLGQAAAGNEGVALATDRFFGSYFLWVLGVIPLPAFKSLAAVSALQLIASMMYRMPRIFSRDDSGRQRPSGWRNLGLYGMHVALLVLLVGSLVGSEFRQEYNGFRGVPSETLSAVPGVGELSQEQISKPIIFYTVDDSLNTSAVQVGEGYPYFIFYKGQVDMFGVKVDLYTATYDPFKFVPYVFMILFLLSAAFHYVAKVRVMQKSWVGSSTKLSTMLPLLLGMAGVFCVSHANASEPLYYPDSLGVLSSPDDPVVVNGVLRPYDSFARGVLNEFSGSTYFKRDNYRWSATELFFWVRVNPYQTLNFRLYEKGYPSYKIFKVLRSDVQNALGLPENERYVSYDDLNKSRSNLELYASRNDDHPATAEMKRLLANVQLYESIERGDFRKATATPEQTKKFKAEVFYNHANFALIAFILAFLGCILASVNSIFKKHALDVAANSASAAVAVTLSIAFALRLYITDRPPLSSLYEIVLLVALLLESFEFGAFLFCKKRTFSLIIPVTAMASVLLFFAKFILEPGDLFQPIPAVLNSSIFLTLHVFTIALGFAGVILSGIVAHVALFRENRCAENSEQLQNINKLLFGTLVFGACLTILGTLLGGVWADFAWGRFWDFDPKECGALFVCLWTMLGLHLRGGRLVSAKGFALFNSFNVIVTLLCWFGINLLGVGLHSYGFQSGTVMWLAGFVIVDSLVICLIASKKRNR